MKKIAFTFFIPALLFAFIQQAPAQVKSEERKVDQFTYVDLSISADVYLTQDNTQTVVIEASERDLKEILTEVKNGHLKIKTDGWANLKDNVKVYISMSKLDGIGLSGSGNIVAEKGFKAASLGLAVSGSGNIRLQNLTATSVDCAISGSGDITVSGPGKANSLDAAISGSGNIDAGNFEAGSVEIAVSGSGDCTVNASDKIQAHVSGSGDIYYKGNAQLDIRISGSGKAKKL
jgi:hypothetical protein